MTTGHGKQIYIRCRVLEKRIVRFRISRVAMYLDSTHAVDDDLIADNADVDIASMTPVQ